jgi:tight adherence protein C
MTTLLLVLGLATFFAGVAAAIAVAGSINSDRTSVARTLATIEASGPVPDSMKVEVDPPFADRVLTPMRSRALAIGRRITPDDWNARTRRKLDLAGNPEGWDPERVLAVKVAWAVVLGGGLTMLGLVAGKGAAALLVGGLFGVGAFFLPDWWLLRKSESRRTR